MDGVSLVAARTSVAVVYELGGKERTFMKRILLIGFLIAVLPFQLFVGVKHAGSGEANSS